MKKYQIIYADPPWHFKNYNDDTASRWVGQHYSVLSLQDIKRLPLYRISTPDCALFLWVTYPTLLQGLEVMEAWGFQYKTNAFTWVKVNRDGSPFIGMGYWTRSNAEICLLGTRGHPKRVSRGVPQIVLGLRQEHSKKPDVVRDRIVELMGDIPRIELFARQKVEGWDCWGNEVESDINLEVT